MKLELKHKAAYLPYDMRVNISSKIGKGFYHGDTLMTDNESLTGINISLVDGKYIKPYLRLFSDLNEDEALELADVLGCLNNDHFLNAFESGGKYNLDFKDAWEVREWLLVKHIDIFGLIEEGLAIDINTVKP